ncbi:hypothetical protein ACFQXA_15685 [Nocardiopsis composta]
MLKVVAAAAGLLVLPVFITAMATPLLGQHGSGPNAATGLHPILVDAYTRAAVALPGIEPGCTGLTWAMIAGIAAVESDHAAGRDIAGNGDITPPVVGPRLDGSGVGGNLTPTTTPTADAGTAMPTTTAPSESPSTCPPTGPPTDATATATVSPTRTTPTTRPCPPPWSCAAATRRPRSTSPTAPSCAAPCSATTAPTGTSKTSWRPSIATAPSTPPPPQ